MNAKQTVLELVSQLPDTASLEDIVEQLQILQCVDAAEIDVAAGRFYTHAEVTAYFLHGIPLPDLTERQAPRPSISL